MIYGDPLHWNYGRNTFETEHTNWYKYILWHTVGTVNKLLKTTMHRVTFCYSWKLSASTHVNALLLKLLLYSYFCCIQVGKSWPMYIPSFQAVAELYLEFLLMTQHLDTIQTKKALFGHICLNISLSCEGLFTELLSSFIFHWLQLLALWVLNLQKKDLLKREGVDYFKIKLLYTWYYLDPFRIGVSIDF